MSNPIKLYLKVFEMSLKNMQPENKHVIGLLIEILFVGFCAQAT